MIKGAFEELGQINTPPDSAKNQNKIYFNWKLVVMRVILNGLVIALTVLILPGFAVSDHRLFTFLMLGAAFGVLNAVVKPIVQILTISLLFVTYGLVIVIINTIMLFILRFIFSNLITFDNIFTIILAGIIMGLLSIFVENLLGMAPPIIDDAQATDPIKQERVKQISQYLETVKPALPGKETDNLPPEKSIPPPQTEISPLDSEANYAEPE